MPAVLTKEDEFILALLKFGNTISNSIDPADYNDVNWETLYRQSIRHSISPILYYYIKNSSLNNHLPDHAIKKLHKLYISNSARNTYIYYHLLRIIEVLNKNAIPFILLKGAHLFQVVYNHMGLRTMADVDILFHKNDLNKAQTVIKNSGIDHDNNKLPLDYHWYLEQYLDLDLNGIWHRAQKTNLEGHQILVLSPVDLILHLCIHFSFHHNFQIGSLRSLYDIKTTIEHYSDDIDWEELCGRSKEWKVRNSIYISLLLAKKMIAADVPENVLDKLRMPSYNYSKYEWALHQIFNDNPNRQSLSPHFWQLFAPEVSQKKLISFSKVLFPSPEFISQKYDTINGTFTNYLHYFIRFKNMIFKYLKAIVLIIIQNNHMKEILNEQIKHIEMKEWLSSE